MIVSLAYLSLPHNYRSAPYEHAELHCFGCVSLLLGKVLFPNSMELIILVTMFKMLKLLVHTKLACMLVPMILVAFTSGYV